MSMMRRSMTSIKSSTAASALGCWRLLFVLLFVLLLWNYITIRTTSTITTATASRHQSMCGSGSGNGNDAFGWEFAGPTTYKQYHSVPGGNDSTVRLASAAAVQAIVPVTTTGGAGNSNNSYSSNTTWFLGSVNGGIWRTTTDWGWSSSASSSSRPYYYYPPPHWQNVLDGQPLVTCSSMSALHYGTHNSTLYAGCGGSTSGEQGPDYNVVNSGDWGGIMLSRDHGDTWSMIEEFPPNYYVTDLLEVPEDGGASLLVAAQSHLFNRTDGGVWKLTNPGSNNNDKNKKNVGVLQKVLHYPTFTLRQLVDGSILATHAHTSARSVSLSTDGGTTFADYDQGTVPWAEGAIPFYTCSAQLGNGQVVVAGLTRIAGGLPNHTDSQFFLRDTDCTTTTTSSSNSCWTPMYQPTRMDQDSMPKDRMALLADPVQPDLLYVAGNAGAVVYRVHIVVTSSSTAVVASWTPMWGASDVPLKGSVPHGDCRNFAWDTERDLLLVVSDGGVFARIRPREPGGYWVSLNGDYSGLELVSAHYDPVEDRYVMGAQDNCAIFTKPNATASDGGFGFVFGDGTTTVVDSTPGHPSRLFGTTQFLGVGVIENDRPNTVGDGEYDEDEEEDNCGGLCFLQGEDTFVQVELEKYFPDPASFPFFVHPYTLNRQDPTKLLIWVNGTRPDYPSGIYQFDIPYTVRYKADIGPPTNVVETPPGVLLLDLVAGGRTAGQDDPDLIVAMSSTHLYVSNNVLQQQQRKQHAPPTSSIARKLPVNFAEPVTLQYDTTGARILGPLTHAKTLFMSVLTSDSLVIGITGWTTIDSNSIAEEDVYITTDAGISWSKITGNLRQAAGVVGTVRPGGILLMDLDEDDASVAVLVGSSNGVLVTFLSTEGVGTDHVWARLGDCDDFPIVLTSSIEYEPTSDRLVAATYGRGIYIVKEAKEKLFRLRDSISSSRGK